VTLSLRRIAIAWRNRSSAAVRTAAAKFGSKAQETASFTIALL
jgi:hypothetical protein